MSMAAPDIASPQAKPPREDAVGKRRRCILSRRECASDTLVRFVAGPDNRIVPDVAERLPGRGLWLRAERGAVDQAVAEGRFAKAARANVTTEAGLADQVADLLAQRCLNFLGLALRSSGIAIGHDQVRTDLGAGRAAVLVQASDGAPQPRGRLRAVAHGLPSVEMFSRGELSQALGRANIVHAVLHKSRLSTLFLRECGRLAGFRAIGESRLPAADGGTMILPVTGSRAANETVDRVGIE